MNNKEQRKDFSDVDYRFSFIVTINDADNGENDIIIVKRDFNIFNVDEDSLKSFELKECVDDIVCMIDSDLKSKSRVYMWYNYDSNYVSPEFSTPIPEKQKVTFKFTLTDKGKSIISKMWSGDGYPFSIRNSVDLTNKKYKYENSRNIEMDFIKQILQKSSVDKTDLTNVIIKHITSVCSPYQPKNGSKKIIYKQYFPDLKPEYSIVNKKNNYESINSRVPLLKLIEGDNGIVKELYEVYTTTCVFNNKEYSLSV